MPEPIENRSVRDTARFVSLRATGDLGPVIEGSDAEPVILFQHDPYCPISRRAYHELAGLPIEAALVDVAQDAHISRMIEERTGIPHESPQVLVFQSGKVVWSASHFRITRAAVTRAVQRATLGEAIEQPDAACSSACGSRGVAPNDRATERPSLMTWLRSMWDHQ